MIELFTGDALESVRDFKIWEHCADGIHAYRARMDCWSPVPLITTSQSVSERDSMLRPLCVLGCRGRERKRTGLKKNREEVVVQGGGILEAEWEWGSQWEVWLRVAGEPTTAINGLLRGGTFLLFPSSASRSPQILPSRRR